MPDDQRFWAAKPESSNQEPGGSLQKNAESVLAKAESLFAAGKTVELDSLLVGNSDEVTPDATGIRTAMLHGMALFEAGDVCRSLDRLRLAVLVSKGSGAESEFSAALALFSRESQFQAPNEALPALSRLRQLAASAGDANSLGGLHLVVARLEACRGHCTNARRHLEISRKLFNIVDRPALTAAVSLVDSGLEMYGGNLARASRSARTGCESAATANLCVPMAGSLTNLGSVFLFTGGPEQARECLNRAVGLSDGLLFIRFGAIDSLAQIALHEGKLDGCRDQLELCARIITRQNLPARSWYDLAHQLTKASYVERLRD